MKKRSPSVILPVVLLAGCLTVNVMVSFPAAQLQAAADEIVSEVQQGVGGEGVSWRTDWMDDLVLYASASDDVYIQDEEDKSDIDIDINITSTKIKALKKEMTERFPEIKVLKDSGAIGENLQGYIDIREEGFADLDLRKKNEVKRTVTAENTDRKALYLALLEANKIPAERLPDLERIFARSWYKQSKDNWYVRKSKKEWYTKKEWQKEEDERKKKEQA